MPLRKLETGEANWPGRLSHGLTLGQDFDVRPDQRVSLGVQKSVEEIIQQQYEAGWTGKDILRESSLS